MTILNWTPYRHRASLPQPLSVSKIEYIPTQMPNLPGFCQFGFFLCWIVYIVNKLLFAH